MVDPFLDPLDTAPVNHASPLIRQRYDALNNPSSEAFQKILSKQIDQAPTPIMTPDALRVPTLSPHLKSSLTPLEKPTAMNPRQNPPISPDESSENADVTPIVKEKPEIEATTGERKTESVPIETPVEPPVESLAKVLNLHVQNQDPNSPNQKSSSRTSDAAKPDTIKPDKIKLDQVKSKVPDFDTKPINRPDPVPTPPPIKEPTVETTSQPDISNTFYTIRRGDTLSGIVLNALRSSGQKFDTGDVYRMVQVVAECNHLSDPNRIYPGGKVDLSPIYSGQVIAQQNSVQRVNQGENLAQQDADLSSLSLVYQTPVTGSITSEFGNRIHPIFQNEQFHSGVDIAVATGTPVFPMTSGLVTFSGEKSGYGQCVEITHDDGTQSLYGHLSKRQVEKGDYLNDRNVIGLSGESGQTTGPHLHFEILQNGSPIDPLSVFTRDQIQNSPQIARGNMP